MVKKPLDKAMACLEHETEVADRERTTDTYDSLVRAALALV
jgi:hypothetical protein